MLIEWRSTFRRRVYPYRNPLRWFLLLRLPLSLEYLKTRQISDGMCTRALSTKNAEGGTLEQTWLNTVQNSCPWRNRFYFSKFNWSWRIPKMVFVNQPNNQFLRFVPLKNPILHLSFSSFKGRSTFWKTYQTCTRAKRCIHCAANIVYQFWWNVCKNFDFVKKKQ